MGVTNELIREYWKKYADAAAHYFAKIFGFSPLREFAYSLDPKEKFQARHLHFSDVSKLAWWLRKKAPAHFYFGPIVDGKLVVSREPVFELDIPNPSNPKNFEALKQMTTIVIKALSSLPKIRVFVTHTGGRSFHVYVVREELNYLPSMARRELLKMLLKKIKERNYKIAKWINRFIDTVVTADIRRLTRLPFSIHGKYMTVCWPVTKVPTTYDEAIELVKNFEKPVEVKSRCRA